MSITSPWAEGQRFVPVEHLGSFLVKFGFYQKTWCYNGMLWESQVFCFGWSQTSYWVMDFGIRCQIVLRTLLDGGGLRHNAVKRLHPALQGAVKSLDLMGPKFETSMCLGRDCGWVGKGINMICSFLTLHEGTASLKELLLDIGNRCIPSKLWLSSTSQNISSISKTYEDPGTTGKHPR